MSDKYVVILKNPAVCASLRKAWQDSNPGVFDGHEEGGFIVQDAEGKFNTIRWSKDEQNCIHVPPHDECKIGEVDIVASFHTHPNTGSEFLQEPSETDKRAVRDDPDLKGDVYQGEFVISHKTIYLITTSGEVRKVAETQSIFRRLI